MYYPTKKIVLFNHFYLDFFYFFMYNEFIKNCGGVFSLIEKINLSDLNSKDITLSDIACIKQAWHDKETYSYLHTPRKNSGLMLTLHCNIRYYFSDGTEIKVPKNSIMLLSENSSYHVEVELLESCSVSSITINFNISDEKSNPITFKNSHILMYENVPSDICDLFSDLSDNYINSAKNMLTLKSKLYELLNRLILSTANENMQSDTKIPVYPAIQYIENNLNKQISISELSKLCAVSESTLRRNFKTAVKMSPVDYMNKLKIQKAKQLLKIPEITINSLCEQLNFYDTSYFYKLFKKHTGTTPIEYRKSRI